VLADLFTPKVIAAVTPWIARGVQIHPVFLRTTSEVIATVAHSVALERKTAL
jgi:hypothetical protein